MHVECLDIPDVRVLSPGKYGDRRGFFSETYNKKALAAVGIDINFVQDNHSYSAEKGTVRGLHFQTAPFAQDKLVRVARGSVFDVVVDLRRGSPTYGRHVSIVLSAEAWNQVLVPVGFAHGFMTPGAGYRGDIQGQQLLLAPDQDKGLLWNDPALGICLAACRERSRSSRRRTAYSRGSRNS